LAGLRQTLEARADPRQSPSGAVGPIWTTTLRSTKRATRSHGCRFIWSAIRSSIQSASTAATGGTGGGEGILGGPASPSSQRQRRILLEPLEAEVLHCHDWHTGHVACLDAPGPGDQHVFTDPQPAYQGPLRVGSCERMTCCPFTSGDSTMAVALIYADRESKCRLAHLCPRRSAPPDYGEDSMASELPERQGCAGILQRHRPPRTGNPGQRTAPLPARFSASNLAPRRANKAIPAGKRRA